MSLNNTVGNNFHKIPTSNVLPAKLFLMKNFFSSLVRAEAVMRQIQYPVISWSLIRFHRFQLLPRKEFTWKCSHLHLVFSIQLYASCFVILIPKSPTINQVPGCWGGVHQIECHSALFLQTMTTKGTRRKITEGNWTNTMSRMHNSFDRYLFALMKHVSSFLFLLFLSQSTNEVRQIDWTELIAMCLNHLIALVGD